MKKNINITYQKEGINLKTVYTIEYIDNKKDFEKLESGTHPAPWELYKTKKYDSLEDAIQIFFLYYAYEHIFDVQLFEQMLLNDEVIREQYVDKIDFFSNIVDTETKRLQEKANKMNTDYKIISAENNKIIEYLKKYNIDKKQILEV